MSDNSHDATLLIVDVVFFQFNGYYNSCSWTAKTPQCQTRLNFHQFYSGSAALKPSCDVKANLHLGGNIHHPCTRLASL